MLRMKPVYWELPLYLVFIFHLIGAVSGEMFRHMQNSEIIRKMTEEFDEVVHDAFYNKSKNMF